MSFCSDVYAQADASSPQAEAVQKANTAILQSLQVDVNSIKSRAPALLTTDLEAWMAFLTSAGMGLREKHWRLADTCELMWHTWITWRANRV
jgi:hypothetical protein